MLVRLFFYLTVIVYCLPCTGCLVRMGIRESHIAACIRSVVERDILCLDETEWLWHAVEAGDIHSVRGIVSEDNVHTYRIEDGLSLLHIAVYNDQETITQHLLEKGADPNACDNMQCTPVNIAVTHGNLTMLDTLLLYTHHLNTRNKAYNTPLYEATIYGYVQIAQRLLRHGAHVDPRHEDGSTPLYVATLKEDAACAYLLLQHGAHPAATSTYQETPLHAAAMKGYAPIVELLLQHGAPMHSTIESGLNAGHLAVYNGHKHVLKILLQYGLSTEDKDIDGHTLLHKAACLGYADIARRLIIHGASLSSRDNNDATPACIAHAACHHICRYIAPALLGSQLDTDTLALTSVSDTEKVSWAAMAFGQGQYEHGRFIIECITNVCARADALLTAMTCRYQPRPHQSWINMQRHLHHVDYYLLYKLRERIRSRSISPRRILRIIYYYQGGEAGHLHKDRSTLMHDVISAHMIHTSDLIMVPLMQYDSSSYQRDAHNQTPQDRAHQQDITHHTTPLVREQCARARMKARMLNYMQQTQAPDACMCL